MKSIISTGVSGAVPAFEFVGADERNRAEVLGSEGLGGGLGEGLGEVGLVGVSGLRLAAEGVFGALNSSLSQASPSFPPISLLTTSTSHLTYRVCTRSTQLPLSLRLSPRQLLVSILL